MTETDYQKLLKGFITVSEVLSYNIPQDMDYPKALNVFAKQQQIISNEETKKFNEKIQTEKFQEDLKLRKAELKLSKDKQRFYETIELTKLDIEKSRLEIEKSRLEIEKANQKILLENGRQERKIRYISLIITSVTSVASVIVPAVLFYKMGILDMKHKYRDEGITSKFYENSMKNVANLM